MERKGPGPTSTASARSPIGRCAAARPCRPRRGCAAKRCRSRWRAPAGTPRRCAGRSTGRSPSTSRSARRRPRTGAPRLASRARSPACSRPRQPRRRRWRTIRRRCACGAPRRPRSHRAWPSSRPCRDHGPGRAVAWRWQRRCCWRSAPGSPAPPGTAGRCTSATSRPIGSSIPAAPATRCPSRTPWRAPAPARRSRSAPAPMTRA